MPEPQAHTVKLRGPGPDDLRAFEHVLSVLIPWRRNNPDVNPQPTNGSPSRIELDPEERHGVLLSVCRYSRCPQPSAVEIGEMTGELAEAWVALTVLPTRS
jgi:hypothetical protein